MALNREKTKALLDVVTTGFNFLATQRSNLDLLISTADCKGLNSDIVSRMAACLQLKELASVIPIDDEFVTGMAPDDFDMVQGLLSSHIRNLRKQMNSNYDLDVDLANIVNSFFEERIMFLTDIKDDLQAMFEQSVA